METQFLLRQAILPSPPATRARAQTRKRKKFAGFRSVCCWHLFVLMQPSSGSLPLQANHVVPFRNGRRFQRFKTDALISLSFPCCHGRLVLSVARIPMEIADSPVTDKVMNFAKLQSANATYSSLSLLAPAARATTQTTDSRCLDCSARTVLSARNEIDAPPLLIWRSVYSVELSGSH